MLGANPIILMLQVDLHKCNHEHLGKAYFAFLQRKLRQTSQTDGQTVYVIMNI